MAHQQVRQEEDGVDRALQDAFDAARRGEIVLVTGGGEASAPAGYLVLAAERVSPAALTRMLQLADGSPVFTTTRERLERLGVAATPSSGTDGTDERTAAEAEWPSMRRPVAVEDLAAAAARLAGNGNGNGSDPAAGRTALTGLAIRCANWGGVVNAPQPFEAAVDLIRLAGLAPVALVCRFGRRHAETHALPTIRIRQLVDYRRARAGASLHRQGPRVRMPTRYGNFSLQTYEDTLTGHLHLAFWMGPLRDPVLTRVHSECLTGDLLGSLRCDCGPQLHQALIEIAREGDGVLLYLRQEGRGIGLVNKLRSYAIQDQGFDTVEANERLGFAADLRDYSLAARMLEDLGVQTVRLLTNNPGKTRGLESYGIRVADRVPLIVEPSSENQTYLTTKRDKLGHWLP